MRTKSVEEIINKELEFAINKFGEFASAHEGYAVILEEVQECQEEMKKFERIFQLVWDHIKYNKVQSGENRILLAELEVHSFNLVKEAIQIAAMVKKFAPLAQAKVK
jgi:hypothetical protein